MVKKMHSLYRMVYRVLRGRILSGQYEPGSRIETEPELAAQFKTSLITIRQAQKMLVSEGLLDKQQGRGTFVPLSVRKRHKILCVCGLHMTDGVRAMLGGYHANLILLSQQEAEKRGMEFETVWLPRHKHDMARRYCDEPHMKECWGIIFVACGSDHPLLVHARKSKLRHVVISQSAQAGRWVSPDFEQAVRLAFEPFADMGEPAPLLMGLETLKPDVDAVLAKLGRTAECVYFPSTVSGLSFETAGYLKTRQLIQSGRDLSRVIFLDDTLAQGGTRAMLEAGCGARSPKVVVVGGQQEMIPLGLPVTFVVHDTSEEVRQAFRILQIPPGENEAQETCWLSPFRVAQADEILTDDLPPIL